VFSLAAGGHVLGGGTLLPALILVALVALALIPVTRLTGRRLSAPMLLGMLGAGQLVLHEAFMALSHPAACLPNAPGVHAGHTAAGGTAAIHCLPLEVVVPALGRVLTRW
jgi:hypothetical protein